MDENGRWFISYWDPASFTGDMLVSQLSSYFSSLFPFEEAGLRPAVVFFGGRNGLISMDVNGVVAGVFINWMVVSLFFPWGAVSRLPNAGHPMPAISALKHFNFIPPTLQLAKSTKMRQEQRWVHDPERHQSSKCNREWYPPRHDASGTQKTAGGYA